MHAVLTNVACVGKVRYKEEVHEGEHQGIVHAQVFEQVQAILNRNARTGGRTMQNKYGALLRGLLRCATCECAMSHRYTAKKKSLYRYYVCRQAQQQGWERDAFGRRLRSRRRRSSSSWSSRSKGLVAIPTYCGRR